MYKVGNWNITGQLTPHFLKNGPTYFQKLEQFIFIVKFELIFIEIFRNVGTHFLFVELLKSIFKAKKYINQHFESVVGILVCSWQGKTISRILLIYQVNHFERILGHLSCLSSWRGHLLLATFIVVSSKTGFGIFSRYVAMSWCIIAYLWM